MSLRRRLALILILATGIVWVAAMVWIQTSTRARVEQALDARLAEAARMVSSLLSDRRIDLQSGEGPTAFELPHQPSGEYDQHLFCQLWSLKGDLVGQSGAAPNTPLSPGAEGFSDSEIEGEHWRVYTAVNAELGCA
ncbi:sensor histidine kinase N-terminal domain-containing protein [Paracoccus cavernae]|uniref:sensor histidine kinase N-terminal domain-containing protein n=1 Tax=Paracoccus cavernae TaxID=1571207 RepID=UPI00363E1AFD